MAALCKVADGGKRTKHMLNRSQSCRFWTRVLLVEELRETNIPHRFALMVEAHPQNYLISRSPPMRIYRFLLCLSLL